jgi:hypothetical protein
MTTSPLDIQDAIQHEIVEIDCDPDVIRERVRAMLTTLSSDDETMGAVLNEARLVAVARHMEFDHPYSGDMEPVVGVFDARLDPMIQ